MVSQSLHEFQFGPVSQKSAPEFRCKVLRERRKVGEASVRSLVRDWRNVTAGRGRAGQHHSLQLGLAELASWWSVQCSTSNSQR